MIEHKLSRVQQCPQDILRRGLASRIRSHKGTGRQLQLLFRRRTAQSGEIQFTNNLAGDLPPSARRCARPDDLLSFVWSGLEFIRWSACTTLVSRSRSHGQSVLGLGRPNASITAIRFCSSTLAPPVRQAAWRRTCRPLPSRHSPHRAALRLASGGGMLARNCVCRPGCIRWESN